MGKKYCILFLFSFVGIIFPAFSQEWSLPVEGKVYKAGKKLEGAVVTLYKNGAQITQATTQANGKFDFDLDPGAIYLITITKPGHIIKRFTVNTKNVPLERAKFANFNPFQPDVTIWEMPKIQEVVSKTEEILSQSLAEYVYITSEENFNFDNVYTKKMQTKLDELAVLQKKAEDDAKKKAEQVAIEQQAALLLENKYNTIIQQANSFFTSKDYPNAKAKYAEALGVKPNEQLPKDKIAEIDKILAEKSKNDEIEKNYKAAIAAGDKAFVSKDYPSARNSYSEALRIKQGEKYPKDRIAEIDAILAKQKEADEKYKNAIANGDKAFSGKDWATAKAAYTEASNMKPSEQYPKNKIAEIDKLLKDIAAKDAEEKAREQKYKDLLIVADKAFSSSDWAAAKTNYTEASGLKPAEQYPKDKIAAINKLLGDAVKQKEMEEKYKAAIANADKAFAVKDYSGARTNYSEALALKPTEKYPKDKITEIDGVFAKDKTVKEMQAKYDAAIAKADMAFGQKNYVSAKTSYTEASVIKPEEKYPKNKIAEIDALVSKEKSEKELNENYSAAIAKGDKAFAVKDYNNAKSSYMGAVGLKPAEKYPKDKIAEIEKILADISSKNVTDKKYNDAVVKADKEFSAKDYVTAKASYTEASGIKPAEQYPKDKIAAINKLLGDAVKQKEMEEKYKAAIGNGDNLYAEKKYNDAKAAYKDALTLKPAETYPKEKIAEIDKILSDITASHDKEQKYQDAILRGDKSFEERNLSGAKGSYEGALAIKPNEKYPKDRIAEIDKLLAMEAIKNANDEKYKKAIAEADKSFVQKLYSLAKTGYEAAATLKPGEQYPKDKLTEINKLLSANEAEQHYKDAIAKGDKAYNVKDYSAAKYAFTEAIGLKPNEKYPKDKLSEINKILAEIASKDFAVQERNEKYAAAIMKADNLFNNKKYAEAIGVYSDASGLKSEEKYPKEKINEINILLKNQEKIVQEQQLVKKYGEAVARGDKAFGIKDYNKAEIAYNEALSLRTEEKYPKDQLKKIRDAKNTIIFKKDTVRIVDKNYDEERRKAYMNELVNKYPQGITELPETTESGRKILTRIVVKSEQAWVYKRVIHSYGATFWYKDDKPITEAIFETDTR